MFGPRSITRPLLAAPFILGGIAALRKPGPRAAQVDRSSVEGLVEGIADTVGLPDDPVTLVRINGVVQLGAGALLALGIVPRPAALALAVSIVPTTAVGHAFWEAKDSAKRQAQLVQFTKNAGLLGGLLIAALDTGSRPSVFWQGRRAAGKAKHTLSETAQTVADSVASAYRSLPIVNN